MSERELLPCPFCGFDDIRETHHGGASYTVWCGHCWANSPHDTTPREAREAWNRRSPSRQSLLEEAAKVADRMAEKWEPVSLKGVHGCESVAREIRLLKGNT